MASLPAFDIGGIPSSSAAMLGCLLANGDEYVRCSRCSFGGCDVRVEQCGCTLHARCVQLNSNTPLSLCPQCRRPTTGLVLFPMSFREIDEARKTVAALASTGRRNRKRKSGELIGGAPEEKGGYISDRRTGRWTPEEMALCDQLIDKFQSGQLPLVEGVKLNDFLGNMLKSKQSRLTKKMKNAKLSSKTFVRNSGFIEDVKEAREFSDIEDSFFHGIQCHQERAEIKFHMQKEWREHFSNLCLQVGQPLDADSWLSSVEEMDRRSSHAKEVARIARRKLMMGFALRRDMENPEDGVFIENTDDDKHAAEEEAAAAILGADGTDAEDLLALLNDKSLFESSKSSGIPDDFAGKSSLLHSAPFLSKAIVYMQRHNIPFEHVDLWVPSFVPSSDASGDGGTTCRLCYAGCATVDFHVGPEGKSTVALSAEEQFNLHAFGDYSQKFSFDVGCGLPGRVYQSGMPTWEQSVQNAPHQHFERCGGALQCGIKTVVGIPIASPNVGRIVVVLYSRQDREKDQELVARLCEEFTRLMPSPKWKLVVDIGEIDPMEVANDNAVASTVSASVTGVQNEDEGTQSLSGGGRDSRIDEVISLLGEYMPSDPSSPLASYLPSFMSLRLMLLRPTKTPEEEDIVRTMVGSYSSYSAGGRAKNDIAMMLARDYMFLSQQVPQQQQIHQPQPSQFLSHLQSSTGNIMSSATVNSSPPNFTFYHMGVSSSGSNPGFQSSPALAPIPMSGSLGDTASIVSN